MAKGKKSATRLGEMLRLWRAVEKHSLRDLEAEIGIDHSTLSRIESGELPNARHLVALMAWLVGDRTVEAFDALEVQS